MLVTSFQTLAHRFHVHLPDVDTARIVAFVGSRATMDGPNPTEIHLKVEARYGFLRVVMPSGQLYEGDAYHVLSQVQKLFAGTCRAESASSSWVAGAVLHANYGGALLISEAIASRGPLLASLGLAGCRILGDKFAVVEPGGVTALPLALRVVPAVLAQVADLAPLVAEHGVKIIDWHGRPSYALQPSAFGMGWRIGCLHISRILLMRDNPGGRSTLRKIDHQRVLHLVLQQAQLPAADKVLALVLLQKLVFSAECFELCHGELSNSKSLVVEWLQS